LIDGAEFFDFGKGARGCIDAGSGAGGNPLALVEGPAPEIDAVAVRVFLAADQWLQLSRHGGDDGGAGHAISTFPSGAKAHLLFAAFWHG